MERPKMHLVRGPILQTYPPFFVRQWVVEGPDGMPHYVVRRPGISMVSHGEEHEITSTYDSRDDLPWVIYALRLWLADRPRIIRQWEEHLAFLQRPEEMARLEADLESEWEVKRVAQRTRQDDPSARGALGEPHTRITADQVVAKQQDEVERIRQLTHEVERGLQTLEAAHPEAVAAVNKVAEEIRRSNARWTEPKGDKA